MSDGTRKQPVDQLRARSGWDQRQSNDGYAGNRQMHNSTASNATNAPVSEPLTPNPLPNISLPKGGGAIRGIGETFSVTAATGTASTSVPIPTSSSRSGFGPSLALSYDSGAGNGPFGFGWHIAFPSITRKTSKGLPRYQDEIDSDVFILAGAEDLVPSVTYNSSGKWEKAPASLRKTADGTFEISSYRPRVEGSFSRIERWIDIQSLETHWRTVTTANVTTILGNSPNSQIFDPHQPSRVFTWLASETFDDKGNGMIFEYKAENSEVLHPLPPSEYMRTSKIRSAQKYPKRIKYGNRFPIWDHAEFHKMEWMFELVFDYGDHDKPSPTPTESSTWKARKDPFSTYRSCFEIRTYRLCQRVLMFHHFPDEPGVGKDCLVSSINFSYNDLRAPDEASTNPDFIASQIISITKTAFKRANGSYIEQSLPPLEFKYSKATISNKVQIVDQESLENVPAGLEARSNTWIDLNGEGVSGILFRQDGSFLYKANDGNGKFGPIAVLPWGPINGEERASQQWLSLAGDGCMDFVDFGQDLPGFYKRNIDVEGGWQAFRAFASNPNIPWDNPNTRLLDLTGDGLADILLTDEDIFTWYPGWGDAGFGPANFWRPPMDEERGPRLLIYDNIESIYTADMSGDGLSDLVRIRNGEICYWPNLGYGHFGAKVSMQNAPWFDVMDLFRQERLRLADINGSGTTDLIYLGSQGPLIYLNKSGNGWTDGVVLQDFPALDDLDDVQVLDFLGQGTSCLVWSSKLPADFGRQMRYVDLMKDGKPYLLISVTNNLGAETHISYQSSTQFYLQDKREGKPWVTKLPFPVQLVRRVDVKDRINGNTFISRYRYHHGFFDGIEREFRGFGMVESWDTEDFSLPSSSSAGAANFSEHFNNPPILTKTWYHTGAYFEYCQLHKKYEQEYYHFSDDQSQPNLYTLSESLVPHSVRIGEKYISHILNIDEAREAYRGLKGAVLRQEIYGLDGGVDQWRPYRVSENNYGIELLQPRLENKYAVVITHPREALSVACERHTGAIGNKGTLDPRVSHTLTLKVDAFGHPLEVVSINYGRASNSKSPYLTDSDYHLQHKPRAVFTRNRYTNSIDLRDAYRCPSLFEAQTFEFLNLETVVNGAGRPLARFSSIRTLVQTLNRGMYDIPFDDYDGHSHQVQHVLRRPISHTRTVFRSNDLKRGLPLGILESLAIPFETQSLAMTHDLAHKYYLESGKIATERELVDLLTGPCRYVHSENSSGWWAASGHIFFSPGTSDNPEQELAYAKKHFFLPRRYRDPFYTSSYDTESFVTYDRYDLLAIESRDALNNRTTVGIRDLDPSKPLLETGYDYRVLGPRLVMDPNRNRTTVAYDVLGQVTATAIMAKPGQVEGDQLSGFDADLTEDAISAYLKDPMSMAASLLGNTTSRVVQDYLAYYRTKHLPEPLPPVVATIAREIHVSDLAPDRQPPLQQSFVYCDGFGRVIQTKTQNDPKDAGQRLRWISSGWTIFNNKGSPVKKYEPFYTNTHLYESNAINGVASILFYDPLERNIAVLNPNHTWSKTVFDSWSQASWDLNDTLMISPNEDVDVGGFFKRLLKSDYLPTWYEARIKGDLGLEEQKSALKTAIQANTPKTVYFDASGNPIIAVTHSVGQTSLQNTPVTQFYVSRSVYDVIGNVRRVLDAKNRIVEEKEFDMLNRIVQKSSMDAGTGWSLYSCIGSSIITWNNRGSRFKTIYDRLRRTIETWLRQDTVECLISRTVYGESETDPEANNLRTRAVKSWDQAAFGLILKFDFKGNLLSNQSQNPVDYSSVIDWSKEVALEEEVFAASSMFDALNRPIETTQADGSIIKPTYNKSNQVRKIEVKVQGIGDWNCILEDEKYNARGQKISSKTSNGIHSRYEYDPFTFNLTELKTTRWSKSTSNKPRPAQYLQDLRYTYDPSKNIMHIHDKSQQDIYFRNQVVSPSNSYTYDSTFRLIEAHGREHLGQIDEKLTCPIPTAEDHQPVNNPGDGKAMARYLETYEYDEVGNILTLRHCGFDSSVPGWTRHYRYEEPSLIEPERFNNRLSSTTVGKAVEEIRYEGEDALTGNMTSMTGVQNMCWNYQNQLQATTVQHLIVGDPEKTWYTYSGGGGRRRKVTDRSTPDTDNPTTRKCERIYLGEREIFRKYEADGQTVKLERTTLHVSNAGTSIAMVELRTHGTDKGLPALTRYQYQNHLQSAALELDDEGQIISYEEYYPFGSSSYLAEESRTETPKRYRFTGKERDEETGFYYFGIRYYASWLGRWVSPDPQGLVDGPDPYVYVGNRPTVLVDPTGGQGVSAQFAQYAQAPYSVIKPPPSDGWTYMIEDGTQVLGSDVGDAEIRMRMEAAPKHSEVSFFESIFFSYAVVTSDNPEDWRKAREAGSAIGGMVQAGGDISGGVAHMNQVNKAGSTAHETPPAITAPEKPGEATPEVQKAAIEPPPAPKEEAAKPEHPVTEAPPNTAQAAESPPASEPQTSQSTTNKEEPGAPSTPPEPAKVEEPPVSVPRTRHGIVGGPPKSRADALLRVALKSRLDAIAQRASDMVIDALLSKDPASALLALGASQKQVDDFLKTYSLLGDPNFHSVALAKFGKLVEVAAAPLIANDPALGALTRYVANQKGTTGTSGRSQPDWWMHWIPGEMDFIVDLTTPAREEAHMARGGDWETALYVFYQIRLPHER